MLRAWGAASGYAVATRYESKTAEPRQQARWAAADAFSVSNEDTGRRKYYVREMFP